MQIIEISSLEDRRAEPYARLTEAQLKRAGQGGGLFIAESLNVIGAALEAGYTPVSFLAGKNHLEEIRRRFGDECSAPVYTAQDEVLEALTGYRLSRGVLAAIERRPLPDAEQIIKEAKRIAVLENVTDPTNVGAIIRSAAGLGMDAVLVSSSCCDPLHRRAARVSTGAVFKIPWSVLPSIKSDNISIDTDFLHRNGFKIAAAALRPDSIRVDSGTLRKVDKLAILLGAEGYGLTDISIASANHTVMIPMAHGVDSLNVAAASAVLFWELAKRAGE